MASYNNFAISLAPNSKNKPDINILVSSGPGFVVQVGVMMYSLLKNNPNSNINIYYLVSDIREIDRLRFQEMEKNFGCNIHIYDFNMEEWWPDYKSALQSATLCRWGYGALYKIFAPYILKEIDSVIALDGDTIITGSLEELALMDLKNKSRAVVCDRVAYMGKEIASNFVSVFPRDEQYFNAGVELLNLKKFRDEDTPQLMKKLLVTQGWYRCLDQDINNDIWQNDKIIIDMKWNFQVNHLCKQNYNLFPVDIKRKVREVLNTHDYRIIHYTGRFKPWAIYNSPLSAFSPLWKIWWDYAIESPWKAELKTFHNSSFIKNLIRQFCELTWKSNIPFPKTWRSNFIKPQCI